MDKLIRSALDAAGYADDPATEAAVTACFLDYAAAGYWRNLDYDEAIEDIQAGEITVRDMCRALMK